jgi:hypothetical protein
VDAETLGWTIAAAVLAGLTLIASLWFGFRNERIAKQALNQAKAANELATERSVVEWQIHRSSDDNAGRFRAYNVGHDTAYEVTVEAWDSHDRVTEFVSAVPPTKPGGTAAYIEFALEHRSENGPDVEAAESIFLPIPEPSNFPRRDPVIESIWQQHQQRIADVIAKQVHVEITWRSKMERWSTATTWTG